MSCHTRWIHTWRLWWSETLRGHKVWLENILECELWAIQSISVMNFQATSTLRISSHRHTVCNPLAWGRSRYRQVTNVQLSLERPISIIISFGFLFFLFSISFTLKLLRVSIDMGRRLWSEMKNQNSSKSNKSQIEQDDQNARRQLLSAS